MLKTKTWKSLQKQTPFQEFKEYFLVSKEQWADRMIFAAAGITLFVAVMALVAKLQGGKFYF